MSEALEFLEARRCGECGKDFAVLYPHLWRYRRGRAYFCSWKCLRIFDGKEDEKNMKEAKKTRVFRDQIETGRQLADAVERGEDPIEFLKGMGYGNPVHAFSNIIKKLREQAPEVAARIPARSGGKKPGRKPEEKPKVVLTINHKDLAKTDGDEEEEEEIVTLVYDQSIAEEYRREQAEKAKQPEPEPERDERDIWSTAAVRNRKMGTFYYDEKFRTVDWRHPYGEEISLPPEDWKWLGDHIGMILHALGVDGE